MVLKLYTFRAKHSGKIHYATGYNIGQARIKTGLPNRDLELEKIETIPVQMRYQLSGPSISPNTVPYHSPRQ